MRRPPAPSAVTAALLVALAVPCHSLARSASGHGSGACSGGGHGGSGQACARPVAAPRPRGGGAYPLGSTAREGAIERELRLREAKTARAKAAYMSAHPCPAGGANGGACPGFDLMCVAPDPANPGRCLDPANWEWRAVER